MVRKLIPLALFASIGLAGCGDTALEQGLIGGGAGAAAAVLVDGDVATGAIAGAAANVVYCQRFPARC